MQCWKVPSATTSSTPFDSDMAGNDTHVGRVGKGQGYDSVPGLAPHNLSLYLQVVLAGTGLKVVFKAGAPRTGRHKNNQCQNSPHGLMCCNTLTDERLQYSLFVYRPLVLLKHTHAHQNAHSLLLRDVFSSFLFPFCYDTP